MYRARTIVDKYTVCMPFYPVGELWIHILFSTSQRGGAIRVNATESFQATLGRALASVNKSINKKLEDFFGLSEYDWTPDTKEDGPSMYLYELVNWLTTVVDTLVIKEEYKDEAYRGAVDYLADCLMVCFQPLAWVSLIIESCHLGLHDRT